MDTISNKEAALLGLLTEKPKHAWEIENDIRERDMRYWTEISLSSVYKLLNKLEERALLQSEIDLSKNNVARKVYAITEEGKKIFSLKLTELLSAWQPAVHPVDIGLANLHLLEKKEALKHLRRYGESLEKMISCYRDLETFLIHGKCPPGNIQLATRRLYLLEGEKTWLESFIRKFKRTHT
ncbi:MAG: PadR family transcriptional regulator [Spirochaetales bacterium]|nr:PadR family transcriptional regulator [Spirochaetales bacterium]